MTNQVVLTRPQISSYIPLNSPIVFLIELDQLDLNDHVVI